MNILPLFPMDPWTLATKYIAGNTGDLVGYYCFPGLEMRTMFSLLNLECPNNLLVKCEAGTLNKWISRFLAEATQMWRWLILSSKTIQALLVGLF